LLFLEIVSGMRGKLPSLHVQQKTVSDGSSAGQVWPLLVSSCSVHAACDYHLQSDIFLLTTPSKWANVVVCCNYGEKYCQWCRASLLILLPVWSNPSFGVSYVLREETFSVFAGLGYSSHDYLALLPVSFSCDMVSKCFKE